ncbi:unnamed protein product [marine sediment metagenome]|uniref:Uncharacterized protein n=1 Tax=marine sediment metagenome TaxID=412755 RepID=X1B734_9ZZZZ
MNDKSSNESDELKELREQTKWLRLLALPTVIKTIEENIKTKEQKRIYDLSDGIKSTNDVAKKLFEERIKVSHMTVYNYWKRWFALGLVVPSEKYSGRYKKIVELSDLNIQ